MLAGIPLARTTTGLMIRLASSDCQSKVLAWGKTEKVTLPASDRVTRASAVTPDTELRLGVLPTKAGGVWSRVWDQREGGG